VKVSCPGCGKEFDLEPLGEGRFARAFERIRAANGVLCEDCARDERDAEVAEDLATLAERLRELSGIPAGLRGLPWEGVDVEGRRDAHRLLDEWARGSTEARGVYLHGDVGVGKTWMAAAACERWLARGVGVRWRSVSDLLTALGLPFGDPDYARAVRSLRYFPGVLVLDDLDKSQANDRNAQPLFAAIDSQINSGGLLVVTANRDLEGMAARLSPSFGDAIASRLAGYCLTAEVCGRDRRLDVDAEVEA
jgi:DNA replication protein DnaC